MTSSNLRRRLTTARSRASVLAAVVTFNPGPDLPINLRALRAQFGNVVVVDNGSANFESVRQTVGETHCRLVANDQNLGIAAALNQAARIAIDENFAWLATFDQDSFVPPGALDGLLTVYNDHPAKARIAIVAMSHRDRSTGRDYHLPLDVIKETDRWRIVRATITAGSLIRTDIFQKLGLFEEKLLIDSVDHEFCLRCRSHGFVIVESKIEVAEHSIGDAKERRILWMNVAFTNHSAVRRYYITRNQLEIYMRYMLFDPIWAIRGLYYVATATVLILTFEQDRRAKAVAVLQGIRDFALRRFGPRPA